MYARAHAVAVVGVQGFPVAVEAHVGRGLPAIHLTGLPGASIQDARERVRPAVENCGLEWPLRRVTVNMSPADLRKDGPGFDLPIAVAVLAATGQVRRDRLDRYALAGELSLKGGLVPTPGVLAVASAAARAGMEGVVVPWGNAAEASLVEGLEVVGAPSLGEVVGFLRGSWRGGPPPRAPEPVSRRPAVDFAEVRGQAEARRALELAAAGGHNVLMIGPPGAGKTMLSRRLPTILPAMTRQEALEVTRLHSVAGLLPAGEGLVDARPFRSPHHTVSPPGLLGGGSGSIRPGEVSLAHHGVLFLDEVTEFRRDALEGLRQPLEDGRVVVVRASGAVDFPARFALVAASNPCPCGFEEIHDGGAGVWHRGSRPTEAGSRARCSTGSTSGCGSPGCRRPSSSMPSPQSRRRSSGNASRKPVNASATGWGTGGIRCNADMPGPLARRVALLTADAEALLARAVERYALSGRGFDRVLKVARTVADLEGAERVAEPHVLEALRFRAEPSRPEDAGAA